MARATEEELVHRLNEAARLVTVGARYAHYKHPEKSYEVAALSIIEATEEVGVVYRALYVEGLSFIRPLSNWLETVELGEGKRVPRFTRV